MSGKLELATRHGQPVLPLTPRSWFEATCGGPGPKLVWLCMCYLGRPRGGNVGGGCWAAISTIARLAECSVSTVRRHLRTLQQGGRIEAEAVSKGRQATHYRLSGVAAQPGHFDRVEPGHFDRVEPGQNDCPSTYVDATASKPPARKARPGKVARRGRAFSPGGTGAPPGSDAPALWSESMEIPSSSTQGARSARKLSTSARPTAARVPGADATAAYLERFRELRRKIGKG